MLIVTSYSIMLQRTTQIASELTIFVVEQKNVLPDDICLLFIISDRILLVVLPTRLYVYDAIFVLPRSSQSLAVT